MPAYIPIADTEVDPESPLTTSLATRWRDNPLAIAEGDAAAPRVQHAGLAEDAGDWVLLGYASVVAPATAASVDFLSVMDSTKYSCYKVTIADARSSNNASSFLCMRFSSDNGVTWLSANASYSTANIYSQGTPGSPTVAAVNGGTLGVSIVVPGTFVIGGISGEINIAADKDPTSLTTGTAIIGKPWHASVSSYGTCVASFSTQTNTAQVNAIRIYPGTATGAPAAGIWSQCKIALYGMRK